MTEKQERYIEAVGRRKTAVARVRITPASKTSYSINEKSFDTYFPTAELRAVVEEAIKTSKASDVKVSAHVKGGGIHSQAEAVRHGIARALVTQDERNKTSLKTSGFLKRDPRAKERRKFGLKKARKAPQWSKR